MQMSPLLTFEQVLEQTSKPHLLLGNGFSMSYDPERFSYTSLLESALNEGILKEDDPLYKLFSALSTSDFENVMKILDNAGKVVKVYDEKNYLIQDIDADSSNLKEHLVKIITNNHPRKSTEITDEQKKACLNFLSHFDKIFTINYDLLLYWATMHQKPIRYTDGFGDTPDSIHEGFVVYKNSSKYPQKVYYLHGGLHFFDDGDEIIKNTYNNTEVDLIEQAEKSLENGIYPIFISEGNSPQKKSKIIHNAYLNHCYKSIRSIGVGGKRANKGDLVVFGTQLKKNDEHILEALMENNIRNIYMGVSEESSAQHVRSRVDQYNSDKELDKKKFLHLYDYKTVNVWNNAN